MDRTTPEGHTLPPVETNIEIGDMAFAKFLWQNGPMEIRNGVTLEEVIDHLVERLNVFNATEFRCRENSLAITALEEARNWLLQRQRDREKRGVVATPTP